MSCFHSHPPRPETDDLESSPVIKFPTRFKNIQQSFGSNLNEFNGKLIQMFPSTCTRRRELGANGDT